MRKAIAFFFLFVITLNIAGYYLVFEGWKVHNNMSWSFDETASNGQQIIIEVPLNIPYATQEKDWEKADGMFEYKGETFRMVKQKITLDAIFIACVKDSKANLINAQQEDIAKGFGDKPADAKQSSKSFSGFVKEYVSNILSVKSSTAGWSNEVAYCIQPQTMITSFSPSIVHPPERIA